MAEKARRDIRLELANELVRRIEEGTAPWQKPWEAGQILPPVNAVTGKRYHGVNYQNLMVFSPDPTDNRWCTYKQAQEAGWQVRKGASGIPIEVWKEYEHKRTPEEIENIRKEREAAGNKDASPIAPTEKRLGVRYYTVFHASQIDGIPPLERPERDRALEGRPDPRLDQLAETLGVSVGRGGGRAFYRPSEDRVQMPPVEAFHTTAGHDTTFLHELSHATGHESRLSRELTNPFGSEKYALEELRAEMSAAMTAASLGIGFDPESQNLEEGRETANSAAYLAAWLKELPEKDRTKQIVQAIKDAQAISDYLIERTPELQVESPERNTLAPGVLFESNQHRIAEDRFGNIVLSRLENGEPVAEVFLQGDDAQTLRTDLEKIGDHPTEKQREVFDHGLTEYHVVMAPVPGITRETQEPDVPAPAVAEVGSSPEIRPVLAENIVQPEVAQEVDGKPLRAVFWSKVNDAEDIARIGLGEGGEPTEVRVARVLRLTTEDYDRLTAQLMNDQPLLQSVGGTNVEDRSRYVVDVQAPERQRLLLDTQGYNYARYVGIPEGDVERVLERGSFVVNRDPQLNRDVLAYLAERDQIRTGIHPRYSGDPEQNAVYFDEDFAQREPEKAKAFAVELRERGEAYAQAVDLDPDRVSSIAFRLEDQNYAPGRDAEEVDPEKAKDAALRIGEAFDGGQARQTENPSEEQLGIENRMDDALEGVLDQMYQMKDLVDDREFDSLYEEAEHAQETRAPLAQKAEILERALEQMEQAAPLFDRPEGEDPEIRAAIDAGYRALEDYRTHGVDKALNPDLVNFLEERNRVRQGEHPDYAGLGDPVANAVDFTERFAQRNPEVAREWTIALRADPEGYSQAAGLGVYSLGAIASQMEKGVQRMERPQVGDLVRFEPNDPDPIHGAPFSGRVIAALDTSGGDVRYHLRAETGPDKGAEVRIYGRNGSFQMIDLDQTIGFDPKLNYNLANALKSLEGQTFDLPNGRTMPAADYLEASLNRGLQIVPEPDKSGAFRWKTPDQNIGPVIRHDGLAAVVRAAEKRGPDVTESIRNTMDSIRRTPEPKVENTSPERDADRAQREKLLAIQEYREHYETLTKRTEQFYEARKAEFNRVDPLDSNANRDFVLEGRKKASREVFGFVEENGKNSMEMRVERRLREVGVSQEERERLDAAIKPLEKILEARRVEERFEEGLRHALEERVRAKGRETLQSGKDLPPAEMAAAVYQKHGIVTTPDSPMVQKMLGFVQEKNFAGLNSWIGSNSLNPASQEVFTRLTGVALGKTQKERVAQLEEWVGAERVRAAREQAAMERKNKETESLRKGVQQSYDALKSVSVRVTDDDGQVRVLDGQHYVGYKVSKGLDRVRVSKEGAVTARQLYNPETGEISSIRDKRFGEFLKRVQALEPEGNVRKAMEVAGVELRVPQNLEVKPTAQDRGPNPQEPQMPGGPENVTILSSAKDMGTLNKISATVLSVSDDGFSARIQHAGTEKRLELARADYRAGARLPALPAGSRGDLKITADHRVEFSPRQKELAHNKRQQSLGI